MFNIFINDGINDVPQDDIFYIISKEGIFLRKKLGLIDSITPVDKISFLKTLDEETSSNMNIPKIPENVIASIWKFFNRAYELYFGEAIVMIYFNEETKKYKFIVPKQQVNGGALDYKTTVCEDYILIGDIHSHGSMSAFHSGTDHSDEEKFDGIHITFGNVNNSNFSISSSIMVNGHRTIVDPKKYIGGIEEIKDKKIYTKSTLLNKLVNEKNKLSKPFYKLTIDIKKISFDEEWMKNVKKKKYMTIHTINQTKINNYDACTPWLKRNKQKPYSQFSQQNNKIEVDQNPCENCIFKNYKLDLIKTEMEDYGKLSGIDEDDIYEEYEEYEECEYLNSQWKHHVDMVEEINKEKNEK